MATNIQGLKGAIIEFWSNGEAESLVGGPASFKKNMSVIAVGLQHCLWVCMGFFSLKYYVMSMMGLIFSMTGIMDCFTLGQHFCI